jgi:2-oxoisovalerate dehydrogenase E1 component beta subunit
VPEGDYEIPLGVARVVTGGRHVTVVGYGGQMRVLGQACAAAEALGVSCELIDLRSLLPWDVEAVARSVRKTGRLVVSHEAPVSQ